MKVFKFLVLIGLSSCWLGTAAAQDKEPTREFTSADGRKLTLRLVGFADGKAELEKPDGGKINVPLTALSPADREYIDLWATHPSRLNKSAPSAPADPAAPPPGFLAEHLLNSGFGMTLYDDSKYLMIVEVEIKGRSFRFQINTGLPYSYIDDPLADVLAIQTKTINTLLAGGIPVSEGAVEDFKIGDSVFPRRIFRFTRLDATGIRGSDVAIDGVLGFDFLQEFGVVIEYHSGDPKSVPKESKRLYFVPPSS
ncbi:MAG: hypothetical protein ACI8UO_000169 [Verrucomicrobiales bacterium]|jgi:hypothetical protein